jgi:glucose-1-phosphatase
MIKLAIFDLGNVLYLNHFERALELWAAASGRAAESFAAFLALDDVHGPFERGALTPEQFHAAFNRACAVELPFEPFVEGWNAIYGDYIPGTREAITQLKARMPVVALTNTNELHCPTWQGRYADALAAFDAVYISNELGMRKPDPEIFTYVLDRHRVSADEAVFFDDNEANVVSARALGIHAHRVVGPDTIPAAVAALAAQR